MAAARAPRFKPVEQCATSGRSRQAVAADLDGTLLLSRSAFPYYLLVALEAGGLLRAAALLLTVPAVYLTYVAVSETLAIRALLYVAVAGLRAADVEAAARSVLPWFYAGDVHPEGWRVFRAFGRRCVVTASPRAMVEPFARAFLGADVVVGTEMEVTPSGRCTGRVAAPGVLVGEHKRRAVLREFGGASPDVGMGDRESDFDFMSVCKEAYIVTRKKYGAVPREHLQSRAAVHDGRLVRRPMATNTLLTFLWMPVGFALALLRAHLALLLPERVAFYAYKLAGVNLVVRGHPPPPSKKRRRPGVLFVCNHRTVLDHAMVASALGRKVTCVVVPDGVDADAARARIRRVLEDGGDVVVFPEGVPGRGPFVRRLSPLFAEVTDRIVPVAVDAKEGTFHASTSRGPKPMDPYFFFMNPRPTYEVTFLDQLPWELTCAAGRSPADVAAYVQKALATQLGFECAGITGMDKYGVLVGTDDAHVTSKE
ncbi:hypothetical protein ACP4OV_028720 [Aristida adscensionis]